MNSNYLVRAASLLVFLPMALTAQVARETAVPLKPWPAPLYWQPTQAEKQATGAQPNAVSNANTAGSDVPDANALLFVGITPCRVVDTRATQGFAGPFGPPSLAGPASRTFPIQSSGACPIPSIAQAYSFNVTVIPPGPLGFITVYPTGAAPPLATTLSSPLGFIVGNAAIAPAGTGGSVDVFASGPTDVVIDINGYYVAPSGITLAQGTASAPALNFSGDPGTGIFSSATGTLNLAAGGTDAVTLNSHGDMKVAGGIHASGPISSGNSITLNGSSNSLTADSATPPVGGGKPYEIYIGADNPGGPAVPFETIKVGIGTRAIGPEKLNIFDPAGGGVNIFSGPIPSACGLCQADVSLSIATFAGSYSQIATPGDVVLRADGGSTHDLILTSRNSNGGGIRFAAGTSATSANNEAERMTILPNGSVGIGTSKPSLSGTVAAPPPGQPLLDVNGKVRVENLPPANAKLVTADPNGVLGSIAFPSPPDPTKVLLGDGTFGPVASSSNAWLLGGNPSPAPNIFGTTTNTPVQLFTNNKYRGLLDANSGFLHLGTSFTTPQSQLHLGESCSPASVGTVLPWMKVGTFMCSDTDNMYVGLKDEGSNRKDSVIAWGDDDGIANPTIGPDVLRMIFTPAGGGSPDGREVARFLPNGNVGIGNFKAPPQPANRLDVKGGTVIGALYAGSLGPVNGLAVQGNLGIGTLTPTVKLDVFGRARVSILPPLPLSPGIRLVAVGAPATALSSIAFPNPLSAAVVLRGDGTFGPVPAGGGGVAADCTSPLNFVTKWLSGASVGCSEIFDTGNPSSPGNVGIGTITPSRKLEVNGDINIPATGTQHYQITGATALSIDGLSNLFVGENAGPNSTSGNPIPSGNNRENTFVGTNAGTHNTSLRNTFLGSNAGNSNTSGPDNTFSGSTAGASNTSGRDNTFSGSTAGTSNITGSSNTFSGSEAGDHNTFGSNNTFLGESAGKYNIIGSNNTFAGVSAGLFSTGSNNTILGGYAGSSNNSGDHNIYIGSGPSCFPAALCAESNTIRIGDVQQATFIAGINGVTIPGGVTVYIDSDGHLGTVQSSRRFKEDIQDMAQASSGLLRLRPVTYRYIQPYADGSKPIDYGLIAEEVAEVYPDLVVKNAEGQVQTVQYHKLVPMLLNEVQKQARAIQLQQEQNRKLESRLAALEALLFSKASAAVGPTSGLQ